MMADSLGPGEAPALLTTPDSLQVRQALDALIREQGEDYAAISRLLGRNPTYVQQFIKRGVPRRLAESDRRTLARHFSVSEQLLGGPPDRHGVKESGDPAALEEDYVLIPQYGIDASAGPGRLAGSEEASGALAFQTRFARSIASGGVEALAVIRVDGDSMYPTLTHGDHILLDTADKERVRDGIYVLRAGETLHVKRVSINPIKRTLTVQSDNPAYPTWSDCDPADVDLIGRVVWVGRRL
jgi:phage repressor protein C with HTH and peptisase S24 domain